MKCLPGQPAGTSTTQYGSFWFCSQNPSCNFFCSEDEGYLFEKAINTCNSTQQSCPECDEHCKLAKMRIMKNVMNANYGRPIFVCSFWVWGDVKIPSRSACRHGLQCVIRELKKEGTNKGQNSSAVLTIRKTHASTLTGCPKSIIMMPISYNHSKTNQSKRKKNIS